MHRAGPGERGGGSYGRRAVAAAKGAPMQISVAGKGLIELLRGAKAVFQVHVLKVVRMCEPPPAALRAGRAVFSYMRWTSSAGACTRLRSLRPWADSQPLRACALADEWLVSTYTAPAVQRVLRLRAQGICHDDTRCGEPLEFEVMHPDGCWLRSSEMSEAPVEHILSRGCRVAGWPEGHRLIVEALRCVLQYQGLCPET